MKFVFTYTRVTNRTESIVVGSLIICLSTYMYRTVEHRSDRLSTKTKSSKKERRFKIRTHAKLLQRNWNANCNTTDQGVISHSRANKKTNFCIPMKLKATISIIVRVIGKMMFTLNSTDNFFLAAPLCFLFGSFVCFLNYRPISLTPGEYKFII